MASILSYSSLMNKPFELLFNEFLIDLYIPLLNYLYMK